MRDYCFIVASSEDRAYLLDRCISCFLKNDLYNGADIYLYWQGDKDKIPYADRFTDIICAPTLQGIFLPRYTLFKSFGLKYDYTILIDDDMFMYQDTSYETALAFLRAINNNGICNIGRQFDKRRDELRMIDYAREDYNLFGGIVFPKKCVQVLVDFFSDTDPKVTEDIFWILLYIKGFDLYRDFSSNLIHTCHRPNKKGEASGYYKWRLEKPHIPLLPQWTSAHLVRDDFGDRMRWKIPECRDVNEEGRKERIRCRKEMGLL